MQEKFQAQLNELNEFNQVAVSSAKRLAEINGNLFSNLARQQMDVISIYMETGMQQLQASGEQKNLEDVISTQSETVKTVNKKLLNNLRVTTEILAEAKDELTEWAEESGRQATEYNPLNKLSA